jgi:signal transduction histidine kinase
MNTINPGNEARTPSPDGADGTLSKADLRTIPPEVLQDLLDIQEQDRRLVAYEIHDGLAQQLTGTLYSFQIFQQLRTRSPEEAEKAFKRGMELLTESLAETRRLINGLRPPILDEHGIVDAIDYLVCETAKLGGLTIEFEADFPRVRLAYNLENTLFRIAQESLTNIRKHSQSERAEVVLRRENDCVLLRIHDWGIGFDPQQVASDRFGLRSIRDRAALLGGRAEIKSASGDGTEIVAELPYQERGDLEGK